MFISDIGLSFWFYVVVVVVAVVISMSGFGIRVMMDSYNGFGSFLLSATFWKNLSG